MVVVALARASGLNRSQPRRLRHIRMRRLRPRKYSLDYRDGPKNVVIDCCHAANSARLCAGTPQGAVRWNIKAKEQLAATLTVVSSAMATVAFRCCRFSSRLDMPTAAETIKH